MSRNNFPRFRPALESLDARAMPSPLLMLSCATGVHASAELSRTQDLKAPSSGEETARDLEPVVDQNGDLWVCYETDNSCECEPWPY
jgi:hypothetical protein